MVPPQLEEIGGALEEELKKKRSAYLTQSRPQTQDSTFPVQPPPQMTLPTAYYTPAIPPPPAHSRPHTPASVSATISPVAQAADCGGSQSCRRASPPWHARRDAGHEQFATASAPPSRA